MDESELRDRRFNNKFCTNDNNRPFWAKFKELFHAVPMKSREFIANNLDPCDHKCRDRIKFHLKKHFQHVFEPDGPISDKKRDQIIVSNLYSKKVAEERRKQNSINRERRQLVISERKKRADEKSFSTPKNAEKSILRLFKHLNLSKRFESLGHRYVCQPNQRITCLKMLHLMSVPQSLSQMTWRSKDAKKSSLTRSEIILIIHVMNRIKTQILS